jgi:hypothetical protein
VTDEDVLPATRAARMVGAAAGLIIAITAFLIAVPVCGWLVWTTWRLVF